jgi:xanthine/uracil permease
MPADHLMLYWLLPYLCSVIHLECRFQSEFCLLPLSRVAVLLGLNPHARSLSTNLLVSTDLMMSNARTLVQIAGRGIRSVKSYLLWVLIFAGEEIGLLRQQQQVPLVVGRSSFLVAPGISSALLRSFGHSCRVIYD